MKALAKSVKRRKLAELESEESSEMSEQELSERDDVEEEYEGDESVFVVGDFVWGKIKNHPWWPGQIYNVSDASDLALKHKPKDKDSYLVAYFGDGTFSWCLSSRLKSFDENFQSFSCQSSSKSFMFAVEDALCVLGELVAQEIGCPCVKKVRQVAENAGIRKGVLVPMVGVDRLATAKFDSAAVIASVKNVARLVSVENRLDFVMLTSKILAFYRWKGYRELPRYYFPVYIDGLEDISKRGVDVDTVLPKDGLVSKEYKLYERKKRKIFTNNDKDSKEIPLLRRKRQIGQTDSSEKGSAMGRKKADRTIVVKGVAEKSRDDKKKKDTFTPIASIKQVGFEPVVLNLQTDTRVGERMSKAAKLIIESPPVRKPCNIVFEKEPVQECGMKKEEPLLQSDQCIKQGHEGIDLMPDDMVSGLKPASFTPLHDRPFGSKLDVFSLNKLSNNDLLMNEDEDDDDGKPLSAIIFMTFSSGASVPSKADLIKKYSEFGLLNEEETDVLPRSLCAQVRFIKKSEGERAFNHMVKLNYTDSGVQYRIRYIPRSSNFHEQVESVQPSPLLSIQYLKEKLETLISKLNNVEGETLSNNLKNELHGELASLLMKLS